jgi:hypothetical protein
MRAAEDGRVHRASPAPTESLQRDVPVLAPRTRLALRERGLERVIEPGRLNNRQRT